LEIGGTLGRVVVHETVQSFEFQAGERGPRGLGGRLLQRPRPHVSPHSRPSCRRGTGRAPRGWPSTGPCTRRAPRAATVSRERPGVPVGDQTSCRCSRASCRRVMRTSAVPRLSGTLAAGLPRSGRRVRGVP
jgi:hypothetical protein